MNMIRTMFTTAPAVSTIALGTLGLLSRGLLNECSMNELVGSQEHWFTVGKKLRGETNVWLTRRALPELG